MARRKPVHLFDSGEGPAPPGSVVPTVDVHFLVTTTPNFETRRILKYVGLVLGEAIVAANVLRDFAASFDQFFGGRSAAYEGPVRVARQIALAEVIDAAKQLGGNAIVGLDFDYENMGGMMLVAVTGTAVLVDDEPAS